MNNEQWINEKQKNRMRTKVEQKNKWKSNNKLNKRTMAINNTRYDWHINTMHNINKSRVSLLKRLKCDCLALHRVKKYPCDYGTNNCNPIWQGINSEISYATEGFRVYLKK